MCLWHQRSPKALACTVKWTSGLRGDQNLWAQTDSCCDHIDLVNNKKGQFGFRADFQLVNHRGVFLRRTVIFIIWISLLHWWVSDCLGKVNWFGKILISMPLAENIFWLFKDYLLSSNFLRHSMLPWGRYNIILKYIFVLYDHIKMHSWNNVQNVSKQQIQNLQRFITKWRSENKTFHLHVRWRVL